MKKPPPEFIAHDARNSARLVEAVTLLISEHASEHHMTRAAVLGSLSRVLGRMLGTIARDDHSDLECSLNTLTVQLRRAAVDEFGRQSFALH